MAAFELYTPQGAEMVSGMIYASDDLSRGNNVKRCDTSCKSAIKMPLKNPGYAANVSRQIGGSHTPRENAFDTPLNIMYTEQQKKRRDFKSST